MRPGANFFNYVESRFTRKLIIIQIELYFLKGFTSDIILKRWPVRRNCYYKKQFSQTGKLTSTKITCSRGLPCILPLVCKIPDLLNRIISLPVPCGSNHGSPSGIGIPKLSVVRKFAYGVAKSVSCASICPKCTWKSLRPVLLKTSIRWSQTTLEISRGLDLLDPAGASKPSS